MSVPEHHHGYLASSLLERHIPIRIDAHGTALAWTDGLAISILDGDDQEAGLAVLAQAALMKAGSLERGLVMRLVGRPALARRYLAVEGPRAIASLGDRLPRRLLHHPAFGPVGRPTSPTESLVLAAGAMTIAEPHRLLGVIRPAVLVRARAGAAGRGGAERGGAGGDDALGDDEAAEESKILKLFSNPVGGGGPIGAFFARLIGMGRQQGADATDAAGAGDVKASEPAARRTRGGVGVSMTGRNATALVAEHRPDVRRYPEWDDHARRYRPAWTKVEEFTPWSPDETVDIAGAIVPATREMRRQLARLGLGFDHHRRQPTGDEIVLDDLVRLVADSRAGHAPDPRIYRALLKTRRDLGVLILLDTSSSVADVASDGRTIQQQQIALAWQIAHALEAAGDRLALYGFNSWGRERVHLMRVKGFDERLGSGAAERLARLVPAGFTRTGAAVRHAGHVVREQSGMPFRLVVLVTDGLSYDDGYEAAYAEADTRRAIAELRARNVACLCLSVGGDAGDDKLKRVFGEAAFLRAERAELLPAQIGRMFARALAPLASA